MSWDPALRLDLGCGPNPSPLWTCFDKIDYGQGPANVGDITNGGLPYPARTFDLVVAHHSLQMIPYVTIRHVIGDVFRVLRPGGRFRISVPDPELAWDAYKKQDKSWFPVVDTAETSIGGKFCAYLTWYSEARLVFTRSWLTELLLDAGFVDPRRPYLLGPDQYPVTELEGEDGLDTRREESLYLVVSKP